MQSILETLLPLWMAQRSHFKSISLEQLAPQLHGHDFPTELFYLLIASQSRETARSHDVTLVNRMSITQNLPDHPHIYAFRRTFCAIFKHLYLRYFSTNLFAVFIIIICCSQSTRLYPTGSVRASGSILKFA